MHKTHIIKGLAVAALVGALGGYQTKDISAATEALEQQQKPAAGLSLASRASKCAVPAISAEQLALIDQAAERSTNRDKNGVVTIPVYWHVITTGSGGGNVSALIPEQMLVLRDAFARSKFAFTVKAVEVIANDAWFLAAAGSPDEVAMKTALQQGRAGKPQHLHDQRRHLSWLGDAPGRLQVCSRLRRRRPVVGGAARNRPRGREPGRTGWHPDLRPGRYRHARGRPLARPRAHVRSW